MHEQGGRGEIPSYRETITGDSRANPNGEGTSKGKGRGHKWPILGVQWQSRLKRRCLPKSLPSSKYMIPNNKLDCYRKYMKDHSLICKFIGVWPLKTYLVNWIQPLDMLHLLCHHTIIL